MSAQPGGTNPFFAGTADGAAQERVQGNVLHDLVGLDLSSPSVTSPVSPPQVPGALASASPFVPGHEVQETVVRQERFISESPVEYQAPMLGAQQQQQQQQRSSAAPHLFASHHTSNPFVQAHEPLASQAGAPMGFPTVLGAPVTTRGAAIGATMPAAPAQDPQQIEADEQLARILAQQSSADEVQWPLKDVLWRGTNAKIIMQNENGPCSLLALCNLLLLENRLQITPSDRPAVSYSYLSSNLAEYLATHDTSTANPGMLSAAISALPTLQHGFQVDIGFDSPAHFSSARNISAADQEASGELALFQLLGVPLVHGWIPNPQDRATYAAVGEAGTYNNAATIVAQSEADGAVAPREQATLLRTFLLENPTQLTPYGIQALKQVLVPGKLAVLFRNSHLNVIYRRRNDEGTSATPELFTLVNDGAFLMEDRILWESLEDPTGGQNMFFDTDFEQVEYAPRAQGTHTSDRDYAYAMQLQDQERTRARALQRARHESQTRQGPFSDDAQDTDTSAKQKLRNMLKRKGKQGDTDKKDCIVM
ncbi:hypothetical protein MVES1_001865 [Malassezia vespertilionis]|uniref:uncharacterized protein n=1 Tax=Malassezia vespertilionis TaxID=2020962 RepID=UPI0024B119B8|nr:uncharacterized protein MVES1_001865 [Malassezia vespertilionis]WFD06518.1 hypothetical protein MVES1_001865 [Malassezia vespertilionis]